ncbi:hypothetical protein GY45DRAFT_1073239 [Cubamyces sp. BRFM 1775]|nr:hypothetical protein GY45DRAFT_1073239 [Cubamyces sp. BRFM 1775]
MTGSDASSQVYYSPSPGAYAVIRLNPVEMVKPFQDPESIAQAQAMETRLYLVYIHWEMALPFPDQPWYRFEILPIAPTLRPEDPPLGITSDMCIPIYPNVSHPTGRAPLHPEPEGLFPYNNCYHWFETTATVRVRARAEEFDETHAVTLPAMGYVKMQQAFMECGLRMCDNRDAMEQDAKPEPAEICEPLPLPELLKSQAGSSGPLSTAPVHSEDVDPAPDTAASGYASSASSLAASVHSAESLYDVAAMDIFSGPDADVELIPLVDLWISELEGHLKQEDIPNPSDMFAEFDHITKIVQQARIRSYAALTAPALVSKGAIGQEPGPSDIPVGKRKHRLLRPARCWKKLRTRAKQLSSRLGNILCLPHIPIWP